MKTFRDLIALAILRALYPQAMRRARAAVVLPLPDPSTAEMSGQSLVALLRVPQILLDPARPSVRGIDLLHELGSKTVRIPKHDSGLLP